MTLEERAARLVGIASPVFGDTVYWVSVFRQGILHGTIVGVQVDRHGVQLLVVQEDSPRLTKRLHPENVYTSQEEAAAARKEITRL